MSTPWNAAYCATCAETGRSGYCAPAGCYCGHEDCYAYASWVDAKRLSPAAIAPNTNKSRAAAAWADREEPTWLDR